jgi:hypothetical protein
MTRLLICACGEEFTPNGREVRCRACRFAPASKPRNKLTKADIPVIRGRAAAGETAGKIAKSYGVARGTIIAAKDRKTWRQVDCEWRPVPGYEGRYEISDYGDVVSLIKGRRTLHPIYHKRGGYKLKLSDRVGRKSLCAVSRLMLMAFCPIADPQRYHAVPVKDPRDLRLTNWQWAHRQGEHSNHHKLTEDQVRAIKRRLMSDNTLSYRTVSQEYGVHLTSIVHIMSGENWNHVS